MFIFFLMIRRSPNSTRSNTCLPYTPLFRSAYRTASLACVEREACRRPSAHAGVTRVGEQPAHVVPEADIGGREGAGCLAYGGLIDLQHAVYVFPSGNVDATMPCRRLALRYGLGTIVQQHVPRQGGFAGTGNAGDADKKNAKAQRR